MKKSEICGFVVGTAVALPIGCAACEYTELIMDKIDKRYCEIYGDDYKKNHKIYKIYRGLIKTGVFCGAAGIGIIASATLGYTAIDYGTLIFKD